jgi:hypothetical protein
VLGRLRLRTGAGLWPAALVLGAVLPCVFLLIVRVQAPPASLPTIASGLSILAGLNLSLNRMAHGLAIDRMTGRDIMLRSVGLGRGAILTVAVAEAVLVGLISMLPVGFAVVLGDAPPPSGPAWAAIHVEGLITYALLGGLIGYAVKEFAAANLLTNLTIVGFGALCPVLYLPSRAPTLLAPVLDVLPPSLEAQALRAAWSGTGDPVLPALALALWAAVFAGLLAVQMRRAAAGQ